MADIKATVDEFLSAIAQPGDNASHLDDLLRPCIAQERGLRVLFANDRQNPILQDPYIGLLDVFKTPRAARRARPRLWDDADQDFVLTLGDANYIFPQKYILPVQVGMRRAQGELCIVDDLSSFQEVWEIFSHGILSAIPDWSNIVVAGGSVLASLSSLSSRPSPREYYQIFQSKTYEKSDVDLFMWGLTEEEAKGKMEHIYESINSSLLLDAVCFRKKNTITIQGAFPMRPLQIVMRLYQSPAEILASFDVDSCCFGYDGTRVLTNPRGLIALIRQCNTIDLSRRSPSYEHRLNKYSARGFEILYPGPDRTRIDYASLSDPERTLFPRGLGRLIVLEIMRCNYKNYLHLYSQGSIVRVAPVPVESLRPSNYDYAWVSVPYGNKWYNPAKVKKHVEDVGRKIVLTVSQILGRDLHYHAVSCGTMRQCLSKCCTVNQPLSAADQTEEGQTEEDVHPAFFRGPAEFIRDDPGRQLIGSFNPSNWDDWEADAYQDEE